MITPDNKHLPYYKRYSSFERFVPFIKRFLESGSFTHTPAGSSETFSSRFNYAVKSAALYNYQHELIDMYKFMQAAPSLTCVIRPGCVLIGTTQWFKQWDKEHPEHRLCSNKPALEIQEANFANVKQTSYHIKELSNRRLEMLIELLATKCFSPMPLLTIELPSKQLKQTLEEKFDIIFEQTEKENVYTVL